MSTAAQMRKRKNKFRKFTERRARLCCKTQEDPEDVKKNCKLIDYKFLEPLQKVVTAQGKIFSRKRSGYCAKCQKMVKLAVKRARYMGLMPYTG